MHIACPNSICKSNLVTALFYRYRPGRCITYECKCRECGLRWAMSIRLDI